MTPSKSGSRTEERGRGIFNAGRPFRSPRTVGLLPFSIRRSPPWLRPAPTRRLCGGQIPATVPVGRSIYARRRAQTRSHPLADPLLPSGGPIRPASYGRLSCACGAIRFGSARQSAPPVALFAWLSRSAPPSVGRLSTPLRGRSARCRWPDLGSFGESVARDVRVVRPHDRLALSSRLCGGAPLRPRATNRWSLGAHDRLQKNGGGGDPSRRGPRLGGRLGLFALRLGRAGFRLRLGRCPRREDRRGSSRRSAALFRPAGFGWGRARPPPLNDF